MALSGLQKKGVQAMSIQALENSINELDDNPKYQELKQYMIELLEKKQQALVNITHLERLAPYAETPRDVNDDFMRACAGKPPLVGRVKWEEKYMSAPLVYGAVVEANGWLWKPIDWDYGPAGAAQGKPSPSAKVGAVFIIALDEHMRDAAYLTDVAEKVAALKNSAEVPKDMKDLIAHLKNSTSRFSFPVGESIAPGGRTWCVTYTFEGAKALPKTFLPNDKIVPFLLTQEPKVNRDTELTVIAAPYYV
ncbi:MAG: hypothetical protein LBN26_04575 [Christensenellaceae bacterium]|jgi:hypothetical protein|nr:hypothetical protein [Christensenellaceae bacterium]